HTRDNLSPSSTLLLLAVPSTKAGERMSTVVLACFESGISNFAGLAGAFNPAGTFSSGTVSAWRTVSVGSVCNNEHPVSNTLATTLLLIQCCTLLLLNLVRSGLNADQNSIPACVNACSIMLP